MVKLGIIKRNKDVIVLGLLGYEYLRIMNIEIHKSKYNTNYVERLKNIAHIAAIIQNKVGVEFVSSIELKQGMSYAESSRKYIGKLIINKVEYILYQITEEHSDRYVENLMYDILKGTEFKKVIILTNDKNRIDLNKFACGLNLIYILNDLQELNYIDKIDKTLIIKDLYNDKVYLSNHSFCDYSNSNKYVVILDMLDAEKVSKIEIFCRNNPKEVIEIVTSGELKEYIKLSVSNVIFKIISLDKYKIKEIRIYD